MLPQSRYPFRLSRSASSHANQDAEIIQNTSSNFFNPSVLGCRRKTAATILEHLGTPAA